MMRHTLLWKTFWRHFFVFLFLFPLFAYFLTSYAKNSYLHHLRQSLEDQAISAGEFLTPLLVWGDEAVMQNILSEIGKKLSVRFTLIRTDGVVIADSDEEPQVMENHANRPEVYEALQGKTGASTRYSTTTHQEMMYVAIPLFVPSKGRWVIRSALPLTDIQHFSTSFSSAVFLSAFIFLLFSAFLVYWAGRGVSRSVDAFCPL